ncbi:hypothetical protein BW737_008150 [Actinomyces ruminis]|uniref:Uncharacterized protein n=1 Tax=Actinomyces ruminis TaxID=1937003 RepID=A0ABX4MBG8_9ACTO|nr:hypothetical protein BW737_008150 [Actinomyces ruminis]
MRARLGQEVLELRLSLLLEAGLGSGRDGLLLRGAVCLLGNRWNLRRLWNTVCLLLRLGSALLRSAVLGG